jgi:hypothetical protein
MKSALRATLLTIVCVLAPAASAGAATFDVSSSSDDGAAAGTFRYALAHAGAADTITFSTGGPITLAAPLTVASGVDIEGCSSNPNAASPCVQLIGGSGFDAVNVTGSGATVRGLSITGAHAGISVTGSNTTIGGPSGPAANSISGSATSAIVVAGSSATGNKIGVNTGHGNGGPFIQLIDGANGGIAPPAIVAATDTGVVGTATPGALVLLLSARFAGQVEGFAGYGVADSNGIWVLPASSTVGQVVAATQTGASGTSQLSDGAATARAGDATVPTATIDGPSGVIRTASPTFRLGGSTAGATVLCRFDSAPYKPCGAVHTPPAPLADGPHTLFARAVGAAANLGPEVTRAFQVDTAKRATILAGPPRYSNRSTATFRFQVTGDASKVECNIDGRRYTACRSSFATGYLLDGRHTFHVRVVDAAGETYVAEQVFTIDTLAPSVGLSPSRVRVGSRETVALIVSCPPSEPGGCSGRLGLSTIPASRRERPRQIAASDWTAARGSAARVVIPIPKWAIALTRIKGLRALAVVRARDNAGNTRRIGLAVLVLPPTGVTPGTGTGGSGGSGGSGSGGSGGGALPRQGSTKPRRIA